MPAIFKSALCDVIIVGSFQNVAPFHPCRVAHAYLEEATLEFIYKDEWPPQSNDCNPMVYAI